MNHLFPYIELALLHPDVTLNEQYSALDDVTQLGMAGLTVAPFWVKKFRRELGDTHPAVLATVVGYPYGYQRTEAKQTEVEWALNDGASEVEIVLNTSALFSPSADWLKIEVAKLVKLAHAREKFLTVIMESALLTPDQQKHLIKLSVDAGADFIKNATGIRNDSFSLEVALQFRQAIPKSVGVKIIADGAISDQLDALIAAGVERLTLRYPSPLLED
ncbi:deoxyribose-phosphate aldolase [Spirosoma sp. KUDC1026]|uniref:deoxyribose-phosphate aldolase n=1 Tax=Spirosoma sp. KUDC1026 TaxID=2745947 RepID=UPI00159BAF66|nr:deoxyribose-phosphate aldolase [Spirosoma sp. KUDC1026]QKZ11171.1 deoxyribose-phosphate aldolase [Spirosoma sp. KUDC1026]